jgi:molybdate transport system substrate-binding protein
MRLRRLLCALVLLAACGAPAAPASTNAAEQPLVVFAAADLQFALADIASAYAASGHPKPTISIGSTGVLSQQIENGAPADVFFAADESYLAGLEQKQLLLTGTRQLYAVGRLVIVTRSGIAPVTSLDGLVRADVGRIAIANPEHAPYGRAARDALMRAKLWSTVQPRLVLGETVSQTFQFVQTGNADAGIVALSLAIATPNTTYTAVEPSLHEPIAQAVAVLARTTQPAQARAFVAFVNGTAGRPIMKKYGFALPGES